VRSLSPLQTLRRGYAVVQSVDGTVVTDPSAVAAGDLLDVRVADGRIGATVTSTKTEGTTDG
jgi:exodeoxyribonuclease VII large subunit